MVSGCTMGVLDGIFWPSLTALAGQYSTHCPQATQFSWFIFATKLERDMLGVLKNCDVRRPKQEQRQQLHMPKILSGPSTLVIWCTRPLSSAFLRISRHSA
jgi:hypothetical protein